MNVIAEEKDMQTQSLLDHDVASVRARVDDTLNRLGAQLLGGPESGQLQSRVAALGQIAAGLAVIDDDCLPATGAGFGSTVVVENLDSGVIDEYLLMVGSLVDIDANQVSLASPIGLALRGRIAGDEITIATPHKPLRLRVRTVTTLMDTLEADAS